MQTQMRAFASIRNDKQTLFASIIFTKHSQFVKGKKDVEIIQLFKIFCDWCTEFHTMASGNEEYQKLYSSSISTRAAIFTFKLN